MRIKASKSQHLRTAAVWIVGALILIVVGASVYWYVIRSTNPIPPQIKSQLTFSPFVLPSSTKDYSATDYKFTTAEDKVQILSYLIHAESVTISVSEYPQPQEFTEIPEYRDRFLNNVAKQYDTVQTANGTIYLGRLERQNDKQLGILIEKGLLVFMSPDKKLDPSQWRNLGNRLEIQKIIN